MANDRKNPSNFNKAMDEWKSILVEALKEKVTSILLCLISGEFMIFFRKRKAADRILYKTLPQELHEQMMRYLRLRVEGNAIVMLHLEMSRIKLNKKNAHHQADLEDRMQDFILTLLEKGVIVFRGVRGRQVVAETQFKTTEGNVSAEVTILPEVKVKKKRKSA